MNAHDEHRVAGETTLKETIAVSNGLGECILWDDRVQQVLWTDMPGRKLYWHDPRTQQTTHLNVDEDLCSFALTQDSNILLCAFESGFCLLDRYSGSLRWIHRIDDAAASRLNDGRVDRQGRFWCGSVDNRERKTGAPCGALYRIDSDGEITKHLENIQIANGLCWSPDGATMFFADTPSACIDAFRFDGSAGTLGSREIFATLPDGIGPDGSTVDADGYLWNAQWGGNRVVRYAPDGSVDIVVTLPVSNVTCLCFGGPELTDLYVTTARFGLDATALQDQPQAGHVFVFETPYRGLPECRFVNRIDV